MKLHLKIEKRAMVGRLKCDDKRGDPFDRRHIKPTLDDSFATFTINGITYQSESPTNCGIAETINRDLEQLERTTA